MGEYGIAQDSFPDRRVQEHSAEQETQRLLRNAGAPPSPQALLGFPCPHRHPRDCVCSFAYSPHSLFIAAPPEHLIKLCFRLLASSVRAQVEVVGLWVLLAPGSPG